MSHPNAEMLVGQDQTSRDAYLATHGLDALHRRNLRMASTRASSSRAALQIQTDRGAEQRHSRRTVAAPAEEADMAARRAGRQPLARQQHRVAHRSA